MEMFLSVLALSLVGVLVSAMLFAAALPRPHEIDTRRTSDDARVIQAGRFFVDDRRRDIPAAISPVPLEALLLQLERHVRLEQAAAESFHWSPTPEALHMRTVSPLVH
jgi:hypothetical protein